MEVLSDGDLVDAQKLCVVQKVELGMEWSENRKVEK